MAQPVVPPDLIGAGVTSQPQPQVPIRETRLPEGTAPPEASMLQALNQPQAQANPGLAFGSGVLGSLVGQPQNAYLQAHAQQQAQQQQEAHRYMQLQQRIMDRKLRRDEGLLTISRDLLDSDSEEARMVGARGLMNFMKSSGQPVPETLVKSLATRRMTSKDMAEAMKGVAMGLDDATIMLQYPSLDQPTLQQLKIAAKRDDTRKMLGLPTQRDERMDVLREKKLEAEVMEADFPELKGNAELQMAVEMAHRKIMGGQGYRQGTKESQRLAYDQALAEVRSIKERELAIKEADQRRKSRLTDMQIGAMQSIMGAGGPLGGGAGASGFETSVSIGPSGPTVSFKPKSQILQSIADLQQTQAIFDSVRQMSKQLITAKSVPEALLQSAKLSTGAALKGNALAAAYADSKAAFLGVLSRTLGGERGVLTDRDIARIDKMLPGFADTKSVRDLKIGLIDNLLKTSVEAKQALLEGRPIAGDFRGRVESLLRKAEGPTAPRAKISRKQFDALKQKGYSDEQILEKYEVR